jgi:DMSO/TMAO reductase YedYZ molybdopterin-dependent catalytic subunit
MPALPPNQQLAAPGKWPVVGQRRPAIVEQPWTVECRGLVRQTMCWRLEDLRALPQIERRIDIHCVTRWSKLGCTFSGVPLMALIDSAQPLERARFVSLVARSEREHSTSLPLAVAQQLDPLVVLSYEGRPLAVEHGGPVRIVVPDLYFYKSVKWLARIELLALDRLGFWESQAGYHNGADPWREERYLAPSLSRADVAAILSTRDFVGRDLRSLDARGHELTGLKAAGALLRDADFRSCDLAGADFTSANLSNARLARANLQGASLRGADVEGADFCGANLLGADFRGALLLGTTFVVDGQPPARIDSTTHFDRQRFEDLAPQQSSLLTTRLGC